MRKAAAPRQAETGPAIAEIRAKMKAYGIAPEDLRTNLQQIGEEMGVDIELSGCAEKS